MFSYFRRKRILTDDQCLFCSHYSNSVGQDICPNRRLPIRNGQHRRVVEYRNRPGDISRQSGNTTTSSTQVPQEHHYIYQIERGPVTPGIVGQRRTASSTTGQAGCYGHDGAEPGAPRAFILRSHQQRLRASSAIAWDYRGNGDPSHGRGHPDGEYIQRA